MINEGQAEEIRPLNAAHLETARAPAFSPRGFEEEARVRIGKWGVWGGTETDGGIKASTGRKAPLCGRSPSHPPTQSGRVCALFSEYLNAKI